MAKTLGALLSTSLRKIREPAITAIDTSNILQMTLIDEANNAVRDVLGRFMTTPKWGLKRTTLQMTDDLTSGTVTVTQGSTTVTSSGNNFSSVTTSMWFRRDGDQTSYAISSIDTSTSPDTLTLAVAYRGTTGSDVSYRCFQDTYSVTDTDFDEISLAQYGEMGTFFPSAAPGFPNTTLALVDLSEVFYASGGDFHRDTSGRPKMMARVSVDSADYPRYVLWPFPTDNYLITLWYKMLYSQNSTYSTPMFSGDAPALAYDAVEARVSARAYMWDNELPMAEYEMGQYNLAIANLMRRENGLDSEQSIKVETYRRSYTVGFPARSGIFFDTRGAQQ